MSCLSARLKACPRGSLVAFAVEDLARNVKDGAFVTAYADPVPPGERIWYLTNAPVAAGGSDRTDSSGVVPTAARIGAEHRPGLYRVKAVLSRRPVSHEEALVEAESDLVVRQEFDLEVTP